MCSEAIGRWLERKPPEWKSQEGKSPEWKPPEWKSQKVSQKRNAIGVELDERMLEGEGFGRDRANGRARKVPGASRKGRRELGFYGCALCFDVCGVSISLVY